MLLGKVGSTFRSIACKRASLSHPINCPDNLWDNQVDENKYWHIVYHTLYFTHLYLSPSENNFKNWGKARNEYQFMGPVPWPPHYTPKIEQSYTKQDLIEYLEKIKAEAPNQITEDDFNANSGFGWLPFNRLELSNGTDGLWQDN